jgi:hypothetical protein
MKKEFQDKIDSTKKFVQTHKTAIACIAGAIVGGAAVAVAVTIKQSDNNTKEDNHNIELTVTPNQAFSMHAGHKGTYTTPYGIITTEVLPENRDFIPK